MEKMNESDVLFIDRQKGSHKLLIVLAGYKETLWDNVFDRLIKYIDKDIDVCIVTSGLQSNHLMLLCEKQDWSYLATDVNNLCLAQNECIERFPHADYIFKMDEDMFVTKNCFTNMHQHFIECPKTHNFLPSAVVPVINVNTITSVFLLNFSGLSDSFEKEVGFKPFFTNGLHHHVEMLENPNVAKFMWSHFKIDEVKMSYMSMIPSPGRFSIGLVLFSRDVWKDMGGFPVDLNAKEQYKRIGLGEDEKALSVFAMKRTMPIMIDFTTVVGHLGYGPQTKEMLAFYKEHLEYF